MSKIDELIAQYCPNGVEFKKLGKVCKFQRGNSITQKDVTEGDVPVIAGGQKPSYYHNKSNRTGETIAVSASGAYAGFVSYWTIPVFLSDSFSVNPDMELLTPKYVYYFLKHNQEKIHNTKRGSGVPHVHGSSIAKIQIPLPPLPVQEEIVNILDKFTELEAKLEAELEARRKQYEYYRNQLLTPVEVDGKWLMNGVEVEWKTLEEVCLKTENIKWKENQNIDYQYIDLSSVNRENNKITETKIINSTNAPSRAKQIVYKDDVIFGTTRPTLKRYTLITSKYHNQICSTGFCVLRANQKLLLPKFLFFILTTSSFYNYIDNNQEGTGYPSISDSIVKKFQIPIPPLSEQERIVEILDKFDKLVNDISQGLPAEIEARRKQYEYYRGKLLNFKKVNE
jgi:type I restriction enzyme S subunit